MVHFVVLCFTAYYQEASNDRARLAKAVSQLKMMKEKLTDAAKQRNAMKRKIEKMKVSCMFGMVHTRLSDS